MLNLGFKDPAGHRVEHNHSRSKVNSDDSDLKTNSSGEDSSKEFIFKSEPSKTLLDDMNVPYTAGCTTGSAPRDF